MTCACSLELAVSSDLAVAIPLRMITMMPPPVSSARRAAPTLSCKGWPQEAALRMLMNNLDPDVAERPDDLVVYGGSGKAARNWDAFDAIVASLRVARARRDAGRAVGQTGRRSSARIPGRRACSSPTRCSCRPGPTGRPSAISKIKGLTMYGQMTAGSWIYIGTQGILQGTYETLAALARNGISAARCAGRSP